jgi:hypothetical protein
MSIDGKWVACHPVEEFGALGVRYLCELEAERGRTAKRLLLRRRRWPGSNSSRESAAKLGIGKGPDGDRRGFRPVAVKTYPEAVPARGGSPAVAPCEVLQQDVSGLVSLGAAVRKALKDGDARRVWRLFFFACDALDEFGKAAGRGKLVPLQCPPGLAVGPGDRAVLLDAELRVVASAAADTEARRGYARWFGPERANGFAEGEEASRLHANALLAYFRELLGGVQQAASPPGRAFCAKMATELDAVPSDADLDDLENWVRNNKEDWSLPVEDEEPAQQEREPLSAVNVEVVPPAPRKRRSLLLRLSLILNLLLAGAVLLLWLLGKAPAGGPASSADDPGGGGSTLAFSSCCVVFPIQGTIGEKVGAALEELFPGKVREVTPQNRDQMLSQKMDEVLKSLDDPGRLKQLLASLAKDHSVRFKGFSPDDPKGLRPVIERGGIFSITGGAGEQYGSLLQANSLDKILKAGGLTGDTDARARLSGLRRAVAEFASLEDALRIAGERSGFLVPVEPTAAAHEALRKQLLSRLDKPVFISRPIPELFDAVDPTADSGGGSAEYTLTLDRKCYWREAGLGDRKNLDAGGLSKGSKDRLKWQPFAPGQPIVWRPIPLALQSGKTLPVASFDIAVVLPGKVVVFRNQNILVGESRDAVVSQGRNYISKGLRLQVPASEDVVSVREKAGQFTGTLFYSLLADQATKSEGDDLQVMDPAEFDKKKGEEDQF